MKFTPAPWTANVTVSAPHAISARKMSVPYGSFVITGSDGSIVATFSHKGTAHPLSEEEQANAALLAAAPELVAVINALLPYARTHLLRQAGQDGQARTIIERAQHALDAIK